MKKTISARFSQAQVDILEKLACKTHSSPSAVLNQIVDYLANNPQLVDQIFSDASAAIKSRGDFLSQIGGRPFYGTGRNIFYSFSREWRQVFILSVSRTLSHGESPVIAIDGKKVNDLHQICDASGASGFVAIRFRTSNGEPWQFVLASIGNLDSSPFTYRNSTDNFFLRLRELKPSDILPSIEQLKKEMEEIL